MEKYKYLNLEYPSGCIIAKVNLKDCIKVTDEFRKELKYKNELIYHNTINNKEWNGYGFKLEDVEKIKPIKVNGKLSLWDYEAII